MLCSQRKRAILKVGIRRNLNSGTIGVSTLVDAAYARRVLKKSRPFWKLNMHSSSTIYVLSTHEKRAHLKAGIWSNLLFALVGLLQSVDATYNSGASQKSRLCLKLNMSSNSPIYALSKHEKWAHLKAGIWSNFGFDLIGLSSSINGARSGRAPQKSRLYCKPNMPSDSPIYVLYSHAMRAHLRAGIWNNLRFAVISLFQSINGAISGRAPQKSRLYWTPNIHSGSSIYV